MIVRALAAAGVLAALVTAPGARVAAQVEPTRPATDPADAVMRRMLDALKADSYDLWTETAPKMRAMSKATFESLHARYGPMLLKGYKTTYLGARREDEDLTVHSWKLEPAGADEAFELRLVTHRGRVTAFAIDPFRGI